MKTVVGPLPMASERVSAARDARPARESRRLERDRPQDTEPSEFATSLAAAMHTPAQREPVREREPDAPDREVEHEQKSTIADGREGAAGDDPEAQATVVAGTVASRDAAGPETTTQPVVLDGTTDGAAAVAGSAPAGGIEKGLDRVDPALQARVERVIERMKAEFGHEVTVVETLRPQERQDRLFAQGRTAAGPVVTWTRNSNHTRGRAADLMVDGSYAVGVGYERLQRVAREEGLGTLGMRDPGHVELPKGVGGRVATAAAPVLAPAAAPATAPTTAPTAGFKAGPTIEAAMARAGATRATAREAPVAAAGVPRMAAVATVATVATPAAVASVAAVAVPGGSGGGQGMAGGESSGGQTRGGSDGMAERRAMAPAIREGSPESVLATFDSASADIGSLTIPHADSSSVASRTQMLRATAGVGGADPLAQIERVAEARDAAASRAPSFVTVRVENGMGGEDRIRLDLRNGSVGATLDVADPALADRISARVGELRQALERRGLTMDQLRVRGGVPAEAIEAARVGGAALDRESGRFSNSSNSSTPQHRPDGDAANPRSRDPEAGRDPQAAPRPRARRPYTPETGA